MEFDGNLIGYFPFRFRWWHAEGCVPAYRSRADRGYPHGAPRARCFRCAGSVSRARWLADASGVLSKYMPPTGWSIESSLHHWPTRHSQNNNTHTSLSMWVAAVDKIEAFLLSLLPPALAQRLRGPLMAPIVSPSSFRLKSELKAASALLRPGTFPCDIFFAI